MPSLPKRWCLIASDDHRMGKEGIPHEDDHNSPPLLPEISVAVEDILL